ncbi:malto-oligosyltrehalose trehalohydrolase [Frankia sp. CNm7]|uniref:Malto-oligosyltrehalose trehalohydrolase n=1 Tax=Frankia nepalensis TaxID=1836974 RepID=A0A937RGT6_9ACTN|nr:malto-oligosyltrehalose trehalohydrolase [Frankia nepalensis]MBL7497912.1 malto-oligosyltrehalose trehalohydrolase [Frankia nepalensis]MBL7513810.1 malto-oligosyltrehalose trehalohydrolase [Frankia nepalensis]MBL7518970.1 malto-oligosyltrehalose trehalohydrolase [Frankia nepalensis]MBL7629932.1 malto-oligosyltrehalose trehalohydrolase [Frankia nepalensis]
MSTFRVWAPHARSVAVVTAEPEDAGEPASTREQAGLGERPGAGTRADDRVTQLVAGASGWWTAEVPGAGHGTDYAFRLDGAAEELPDPRSPWQPYGVHGRSRVVDHGRFGWTDGAWRGVPLAGSVLYELHVGTFTPEGTFDAAIGRLGHLVDLGIDAVELLPVNAFPGRHGWGYDGVGLFAPHDPYGGPDGLKRFVDAAHAHGLGVIMDVVYNHLGPDGNYLGRFGPYFTDNYRTPWGSAVNLDDVDSDEVRAFAVDNALSWLRDYHCDGLRVDAVHALRDSRAVHVLEELSDAVHRLGAQQRRPLFLIAESDLNDPRVISPPQAGGHGMDGQWADDIHHALWATLSGERQGYYGDFGAYATLAKAFEQGFVHDGTYSAFRGRAHGRPIPKSVPASRLVAFLQDHDQVGNRAIGDRAAATLSDGLLRVGAALLLAGPFTPMLFMGEEWGATTPWAYFTDHGPDWLAQAVRDGRRAEFAAHGWGPADVPDPQAEATFTRSKLDWSQPATEPHRGLLDWYRRLVALRRAVPELADPDWASARCAYDEHAGWFVLYRGGPPAGVAVVCNLSAVRQSIPVGATGGEEPEPAAPGEVVLDVLAASTPGFVYQPDRVETDGESVVIARLLPRRPRGRH